MPSCVLSRLFSPVPVTRNDTANSSAGSQTRPSQVLLDPLYQCMTCVHSHCAHPEPTTGQVAPAGRYDSSSQPNENQTSDPAKAHSRVIQHIPLDPHTHTLPLTNLHLHLMHQPHPFPLWHDTPLGIIRRLEIDHLRLCLAACRPHFGRRERYGRWRTLQRLESRGKGGHERG